MILPTFRAHDVWGLTVERLEALKDTSTLPVEIEEAEADEKAEVGKCYEKERIADEDKTIQGRKIVEGKVWKERCGRKTLGVDR